jgi:hypothetical protein
MQGARHRSSGRRRAAQCGQPRRSIQAVGYRFVADHPAVLHRYDARSMAGDIRIVGDQQQRPASPVQGLEQGHDFETGDAVEGTRGFVGENQQRVVDQRAGNRYPLLLAAGKLARALSDQVGSAE